MFKYKFIYIFLCLLNYYNIDQALIKGPDWDVTI